MTRREPRVVAVVQARMGSSRLPGKVLADVAGHTVLDHLLRRLAGCHTLDAVVIATSTAPADDALEPGLVRWLKAAHPDVRLFRGSESDVLARFAGAAAAAEADVVVRLTGDCPLIDGVEVDRVVGAFLARRATGEPLDFLRNQRGAERRIPHGLDVEVMTRAALDRAHEQARAPGEREHVTPWLYAPGSPLTIDHTDPVGPDWSDLRLTVDTPEDLEVIRRVVAALGATVTAGEACAWLAAHPEVRALQEGLQQRGTASAEDTRAARVRGKRLLARVDAGPGIGFGHMARVEALASAWVSAGGRATLLGAGLSGPVAARLRDQGVTLTSLERPAAVAGPGGPDDVGDAPSADATLTLGHAARLAADVALVDGYPFRADWQARVAAALPLVAIDDLAAFPQVADVVVNQNVGFDAARYERAAGAGPGRTLAGAPFVLLRSELRAPRQGDGVAGASPGGADGAARATPGAHERRVLVVFGGADLGGWTLPTARALLAELPADVRVDVLLGSGAQTDTAQALSDLAEAEPRLLLRRSLAAVAPWMDGATLAVCAAGSTCWELLARGVVPVAVPLAENQRAVASGLATAGAGVVPGWHEDVDAAALAAACAALLEDDARRAALQAAGSRLIDGRGVWRVIDAALDAIDRRGATAR